MRKKYLDPKHPDLATRYNNIGLLYLDQGNRSLSLDYFTQAVSIYELLAQAYEALGIYAEAREYRAQAEACLSFQL